MAIAISSQSSQSMPLMSESSAQNASALSVSENLHSAMQAIGDEKFASALQSLNRAIIDADPFQLAECYGLRGFVRLRLEQFEQAEEDCNQSIRRRGDDPETLTWRAAARAEREDWRGAFSDLDRARHANPGQSDGNVGGQAFHFLSSLIVKRHHQHLV